MATLDGRLRYASTCRTQDMAGDPFGLLLRQRIVFLGGEASLVSYLL